MKKTICLSLLLLCFLPWVGYGRELDQLADLSLTITSPQTVATNGGWVTFYITAKNNGPTPIYAIDACEIQCNPAGGQYGDNGNGGGDWTDAVVSVSQGSYTKDWWDICWFPGAIAPGQALFMTVSIPLHLRYETELRQATLTGYYSNSDVCDTNPLNDAASLLLDYYPACDLSISIFDGGNTSWILGSGAYEVILTVLNSGPSIATGAVVTNILPLGCTYQVVWPKDPVDFSFQGNVLRWNISDHNDENSTDLPPSIGADMVLQITPTNVGEKVISSQLTYRYDSNSANNTARNSMPVSDSGGGEEGDVSLLLMGWDVVPTVERYGTIEYVLRLKNNGLDALDNVVITNIVDKRCLFDTASTPQGSFSENAGLVVFNLGTVGVGADLYIDLNVIPLESGTITNDARVYLAATGNEYGDSAVIEETTVNPGPPVLTVSPMNSVTPTLGSRMFVAVVQTNGQAVVGVTVHAEVTRGPHTGVSSNVVTSSVVPEAPPAAIFVLKDEDGYPGRDTISVTGQVGRIPFSLSLQADWQTMGPYTYVCTNLGFITESGIAIFEIEVPEQYKIADIQIALHFKYTYPRDLEFRMYSPYDPYGPTPIEAVLIEELDAFEIDDSVEDLEVGRYDAYCILDESAATSISNAVAPFSGSYSSQFREMTNYVGTQSLGTWVLAIEDMNIDPGDFDFGVLFAWTLTLEPIDGDLDNDGMNDAWELSHGLDPTNPLDALTDKDQDGSSNYTEFRTHRNPQNPDDSFAFSRCWFVDNRFWISWESTANQFYTIYYSTNLVEGVTNVLDSAILATPPQNNYAITNSTLRSAFFLIEQEF